MIETPTKALVLVDIQNDFLPGGALAVPDGDAVIPVVLALMASFEVVVATQDYHPADHGSFASQHGAEPYTLGELGGRPQVLWPDHCVQGTPGVAFPDDLPMDRIDAVFPKGMDRRVDSYSGFFDNDQGQPTGLGRWLRTRGIEEVTIVGLATDYCVKATALDALNEGFEVTLVLDGCRAVKPEDGDAAIAELEDAGVEFTTLAAFTAAHA